MLNAEKNKKVILDLTEGGCYFAVRKDGQNIARSCDGLNCEDCVFDEEEDCSCSFSRMKWMLSEYKESVKPTKLEYELLKFWNDKEFKYIARDSGGTLFIYNEKPSKKTEVWGSIYGHRILDDFEDLFQFVKWADTEPTLIKGVLESCEVVEDE